MATFLIDAVPEQDWKHASPHNGRFHAAEPDANGDGAIDGEDLWRPAIDQIVAMQQLGEDWDGLGASAPSCEVLECAIGLAYLLDQKGFEPPSCVVPSTAGTLALIWHFKDGGYCDIEIDRPFHADVTWIESGQSAKHWELPSA